MRNKRFLVVLTGALFFGLLAAVSVGRYVSGAQAYTKNLNKIVVAKVAIPLGTKIVAEQLTTAQFPSDAMPDGTFDSVDKLTGRVAITQINAREPITETKLAAEGTAGGLSAVIPEGYRAMTVKVDDVVGISGFIQPGTLVDVVVVIDPDKGMNQNPISKIVLQNIKVLANGQNIDQPKNDREANSVKAITLQVLPEQAEKLALASSEGKLQLVMRNSIDQDDSHTNGVNKRGLLTGDHASPLPEPGALKSEQPKPAATSTITPRRQRASATADYSRHSSASVTQSSAQAEAAAQQNAKPAAPARPSVEMIEGSKKRNIDFP